MILALLLAAQVSDVSVWCADRVVGENSTGRRYAITYLYEGEPQTNGTTYCPPLDSCSRADLTRDGPVGGPDFSLLIGCWGTHIEDWLPPSAPAP